MNWRVKGGGGAPVVEPTMPLELSTISRNWPMTRGTDWMRRTSSWALSSSRFRFLCSSFMYSSCMRLCADEQGAVEFGKGELLGGGWLWWGEGGGGQKQLSMQIPLLVYGGVGVSRHPPVVSMSWKLALALCIYESLLLARQTQGRGFASTSSVI